MSTPAPELDIHWMTNQVVHILLSAVDGQSEQAAQAICDVGTRYGSHGVYCMCCALADAIVRMGDYERASGEDFWGFEIQHLDRGLIAPEDLDPKTKPMVAAWRFVTAYMNHDTDQQMAIFDAGLTQEHAVDLPAGLTKLAAAFGRYRLAQEGSGPGV